MASTFTTMPGIYDQTSIVGTKKKLPVYVQFVPGIVAKVTTGEDSVNCEGDLRRIGSIIAMPHFGDKGIKKTSTLGEEFRYYPLLRGIQETPTPGDPVLLTDFGGVQYYMGPLNTEGLPNFNNDKYKNNEVKNSNQGSIQSKGSLESNSFLKKNHKRLQKLLNSDLDNPLDINNFVSQTIHGDLVLEGRHGNSLRIGSRNINPYLIISNGRNVNNPIETSLDGTILAILENGSIRNHFNMDPILDDGQSSIQYKFKLADEGIPGWTKQSLKSISSISSKPLGSGRKVNEKIISAEDKIYNYKGNQLFASSDRLTFNARSDSIFLSAYKHIHIGCGSSMTFSTSKNILTEAFESVKTYTHLFEAHAETVIIDGRKKVVIGDSLLNDNIQKAVVGDGLINVLTMIIDEIKNLAYSTSEAIENRSAGGGSLGIMEGRVKALDMILGMEEYEDPILEQSYELPETLRKLILSDKVFIKK